MRITLLILGMTLCLAAPPASGADDVRMQSAIEEKAVAPASPAAPEILPEMAEFGLTDRDILSWEESGEGKYFYFTLTTEKDEELATLSEKTLGQPLRINLNDHFIIVPEVTAVLSQKNGFVLLVPDKGNRFTIARMLNAAKRKEAVTVISLQTKEKSKE